MFEHYLLVSNSRTGAASDEFETYSIANYVFYTINDCWRAGLCFEWLRDNDGILTGFDSMRPPRPATTTISLSV